MERPNSFIGEGAAGLATTFQRSFSPLASLLNPRRWCCLLLHSEAGPGTKLPLQTPSCQEQVLRRQEGEHPAPAQLSESLNDILFQITCGLSRRWG